MRGMDHATKDAIEKKPAARVDSELLDILKKNEKLQPLEAFAERVYGIKGKEMEGKDVEFNVETRLGANAIGLASLSSRAVLRAVGVMNSEKGE